MSKIKLKVGNIYRWNDEDNYTILAINKDYATIQFDSGLRFDYGKDHIEQSNYVNSINMTAEIRQRLEVKHIENKLNWETKRILLAQSKVAELNEKLDKAKELFDHYEDICTDCLSSSMKLPNCNKCKYYKEIVNGSI